MFLAEKVLGFSRQEFAKLSPVEIDRIFKEYTFELQLSAKERSKTLQAILGRPLEEIQHIEIDNVEVVRSHLQPKLLINHTEKIKVTKVQFFTLLYSSCTKLTKQPNKNFNINENHEDTTNNNNNALEAPQGRKYFCNNNIY